MQSRRASQNESRPRDRPSIAAPDRSKLGAMFGSQTKTNFLSLPIQSTWYYGLVWWVVNVKSYEDDKVKGLHASFGGHKEVDLIVYDE